MLYDIILYHIFIIYYICYIIYTYIIYTYIIYTYIIIIYTYIIFIYYIYIYIYVRCIYIILYYICILYIYTIIHVIGWRFCCCFYPPKSWFLLVCLGDKVYLPGSRWFQPSDSTAPVFLSLPTRWAVGLLTKWPTNLEALVPLAGHLKIRSFPNEIGQLSLGWLNGILSSSYH